MIRSLDLPAVGGHKQLRSFNPVTAFKNAFEKQQNGQDSPLDVFGKMCLGCTTVGFRTAGYEVSKPSRADTNVHDLGIGPTVHPTVQLHLGDSKG